MTRNQKIITVLFAVLWGWAAIAPISRADWLLENTPIIVFALYMLFSRERLKLSDISFAFIAMFLALHLIGAHYTYEQVPFGRTLEELLGSTRNMYDRLVHFSFGFLIFFPLYEIFQKIEDLRRSVKYYLPVLVVLSSAALYEIFEWSVASVVSPILSVTFVGSQGDLWDVQKDMAMAFFGAALMMFAVFVIHMRKTRNK